VKVRRRARILALQALYEIDTTQHLPGSVLDRRLGEEPLPEEGEAFVRELITGVLEHRTRLDEIIQEYAPEWPVDQMAVIDRNVLRMAIFEFHVGKLTPIKVAINEAVELAKLFGSDSAPRFINGVLGAVAALGSA
jgi:N utilization substance protein B